MPRPITAEDTRGMVHDLPWCRDLRDWTTTMLQRGTQAPTADSPALRSAMRRELSRRGGSS